MKILYTIIDGEITGGNIVCLQIIEESLKRGYAVVVNSPSEGKFTHILKEKGIKVYNIDTRHLFDFGSIKKLAEIIKKEGISLLHSHTPINGRIWSCFACGMEKIPGIIHIHAPDFFNPSPLLRPFHFLLNWLSNHIFPAKVIAVSESVKMAAIKLGIAANKITVVYNGIDLDSRRYSDGAAEIRNEFGLKPSQPVIGEVGRLCESKGQRILIMAARKVIEKIPDAVFFIIGEDLGAEKGYRKTLEGLVKELGLERKVIFTGYRCDISKLMQEFEIFVLPSVLEGLPMVILQAMAAKKPVITTTSGGNPEIVVGGRTGSLVPPLDPDKLAEAIIYHLKHPEISRKMGDNGYARVKEFFSLSQMLDKVMNIYKEVIAGG